MLLAGVLGVAVYAGIPAAGLGESLAAAAEEALGVEITRGRFELRLLEGLVLEDGEASAATEGRRYRFELPRVVFEHRPGALLSGALSVRRVRFERPVIELIEVEDEDGKRASETADVSAGWIDLQFDLEEVVLADAKVQLGEEGAIDLPVTLDGVGVALSEIGVRDAGAESSLLSLEGSGVFTAREARLGEILLSDAEAEIYLHDRKVSLTLLNCVSEYAAFVAEMRVDLSRSPFGYQVSTLGEPFDAARLAGAKPGSLGETSLLVEVFGRGPAPSGFRAQGSLTLPEGTLPEAPIFEAVNDAVGREVLAPGASLAGALAVYRVRDGYVLFEPFELQAGETRVTVRGRVFLDRRLELELDVLENGRTTTLALTGTIERPEARTIAS